MKDQTSLSSEEKEDVLEGFSRKMLQISLEKGEYLEVHNVLQSIQ